MSKTMTEPLRITAVMLDGRLCSSDGWLFLDAILYHAWFMENFKDIYRGTLASGVVGHIGLPLRRYADGTHASSVGFYKQYGTQIEYWNKKPSAHNILGEKYIDFGKKRGKINVSSGEYKAYRMPEVIRLISDVTFYAYGNKGKIENLLKHMKHIGKKTAIGWGRVKEWRVESVEDDRTDICEYGLSRPIPVDSATVEQIKVAHTIQRIANKPPYWNYKNTKECFVPNPIVKE